MTEFLTTKGVANQIEKIIKDAEKYVVLVSPYLNLSKEFLIRLEDAIRKKIRITLIYGKEELSEKERIKIESLSNIEVFFCDNLHAKCYLNEKALVITSLNLYEYSEINNREMGILIEKNSNNKVYEDALEEIESIKNSSKIQNSFNDLDISNLVYLDEYKNQKDNFYIPSLCRLLQHEFCDYQIEFDNEIKIKDFPVKGIKLNVTHRIVFIFSNKLFFEFFEKRYSKKLSKLNPKARFYWKYKRIYIS